MEKTFIFGHHNPDTDSVCSAIALSYYKNKLGFNTEPRILDEINKETEYVLNYFDVSEPAYLDNVKLQIKDIYYHKNFFMKSAQFGPVFFYTKLWKIHCTSAKNLI